MDTGSSKLERTTTSVFELFSFHQETKIVTHMPSKATFRLASGESTGVPPGGSMYGILTCFDNVVN